MPSRAPEITARCSAGTPSAVSDARACSASSGETAGSPYSSGARRREPPRRSCAAAIGSSAGSGLPVERSRTPCGTASPRSERGVVAGRSRTRVPRRPAVSTAPRSRSRR